jgi:hypothetical protein
MNSHGPGEDLLPLLAPPFPSLSRSRRIQQRYTCSAAAVVTANFAISSVNALHRSFARVPDAAPESGICISYRRGTRPRKASHATNTSSASQNRMLQHIRNSSNRFVSRLALDSVSCGFESNTGSASSPSLPFSSSTSLSFDSKSAVPFLFNDPAWAYANTAPSVVPLIASRVSLPTTRGSIQLLDFLPPDMAALYRDTSKLLLPPAERQHTPRPVCAASHAEYLGVLKRMQAADMLDFTTAPAVVNGIFGVPKDEGTTIRLIIDARPANAVFVPPPSVSLPTPDLLAALVSDPSQLLYVLKEDVDNMHRIKLPPHLRPFFCLPPVRCVDVGLRPECGVNGFVWPMCSTMPMGWSHAVALAQNVHQFIVDECVRLPACDRVAAHTDLNTDRPRHFVYIDDFVVLGHDPVRMRLIQARYTATLASIGLVVKKSKSVAPSANGVAVIGLELDGRSHTVGVSAVKLRQLQIDTETLLARTHCSGHQLHQLVGRWTWAALASRAAFAVFNSVYRFVESAGYAQFEIWPSVANELRVMCGLAPLLFSNLSAGWFKRMVAVDASMTGQGVVAASLPPARSGIDLSRVYCDPPDCTGDDYRSAEFDHVLASEWRTIVSSHWNRTEHINVLECRALTTAVRWCLSHPLSTDRRLLLLSDSGVVVGAVRKGRSSSQPLLRRLRQLSALLLASGLRLRVCWVPTDQNPADAASRRPLRS